MRRLTEAIEKLRTVSLHIDESAGLNSSELRANARRLARKCGKLGLIVVDYLQLMSGSGGGSNGENRATELVSSMCITASSCEAKRV